MAAGPHVLVVEDDFHVVQGVLAGLRDAGMEVSVCMDGEEACRRAIDDAFDLVVLDLMLPGRTGFDVLRAMDGRCSTPVVVLSARSELEARLDSFALGAVDYVAKPFFMEELVARIHARLGRTPLPEGPVQLVGGTELHVDGRYVLRDGEDLGLTPHEFNVLLWLVERPGRAVSRDQLAEHALGVDGPRDHRTVDSHVSRVRKKLGADGGLIRTVWGIGYRFDPEGP